MPLMPSDIPQALEAMLKVIYLEEAAAAKPDYPRVCTQVDTTQETQTYGWVGSPPAIREWVDERVAKGLTPSAFSLKDRTWEATIAVSRREMENDQMGVIQNRVRDLARRMAQGIDELAFSMLLNANQSAYAAAYGYSWDNYDKNGTKTASTIYFADTDHVYPAPAEYTTAQSNKGTAAFTVSDLFACYTAMMTWKDDRGKILPYKPDLLICAPQIYKTCLEALAPLTVVAANATTYNNMAPSLGLDLIMSPYWADDLSSNSANWALACTSGVTKPLILQIFTPAANGQLFEFSALEGSSDNGFMRDTYYYGIRGRWMLGYGDWRSYYLNVVAGS